MGKLQKWPKGEAGDPAVEQGIQHLLLLHPQPSSSPSAPPAPPRGAGVPLTYTDRHLTSSFYYLVMLSGECLG